ncbi:MAG TPA: tetratricopeptide repeat protein, partial [Pyrinomonadaceae bacterium]|nr:tetratricopeptide repeat protein [Pyrinomonadaceae bacterium]
MSLQQQIATPIDRITFSSDEAALTRCALAKKLEESGNFEAARGAMGKYWQRVGERPLLVNLTRATAAEVLLRAGTLSGWLGSVHQIEGAQENAKDLLSESITDFAELGRPLKAGEGKIELAYCYWRQGAYDEARVLLADALAAIGHDDAELRAKGLLRTIIVERTAHKQNTAWQLLQEAAPLFEQITNSTVKGGYHVELAVTLKNTGFAEGRADYIDRALVEYAAASYHFEQAGHQRYRANVENNLGNLFYQLHKYEEAHRHLERARRLFVSLKDKVHGARTDETLANVLLAQGRNSEAERCARAAVRALEDGEELALLAQVLVAHATALARLHRPEPARAALYRAMEAADMAGD